jgi:membrane protein implicated in regulation of membrane protease activity
MEWLKDFLKPELIWFVVGLVLLVMEFVIPGLIVSFFGVGAWIVAVVCLFKDISLNTQLGLFIVSSLLSLILLRSWVKGIFMGHITAKQDLSEDLKDFVGERAVVVEKITPRLAGKVELHGTNWVAEADAEIAEGTAVEVVGKRNITLKVKAV